MDTVSCCTTRCCANLFDRVWGPFVTMLIPLLRRAHVYDVIKLRKCQSTAIHRTLVATYCIMCLPGATTMEAGDITVCQKWQVPPPLCCRGVNSCNTIILILSWSNFVMLDTINVTFLQQLAGTPASVHPCLRFQPTQPITSVCMVTYNKHWMKKN
jgi:hypothetical protein